MPRRSSSSGSSRRSTTSSGSRSASTSATSSNKVPARTSQPQAQVPAHAPARPASTGLFGQMASTAAGVAVGHTIGNSLSNALFGGRSHEEVQEQGPLQAQQQDTSGGVCAREAKEFTQCMNATGNDVNSCLYFLESMKSCQQNANSSWA